MAYQTPAVLKNFFAPKAKPTGAQFADFIDSVHTEIINVKAFGAKGDGVTNDRAAIQAAITAALAANGVVYFPQGTYIVNTIQSQVLPAGYSGTITDCAFFINGAGQRLVLRGESWKTVTIKPQTINSGGWLFFAHDIDLFDTDEISFESADTIEGRNGAIFCSGVKQIHLGRQFYKGFGGSGVIVGASFVRVPDLLTFSYQEFENMFNSLSFQAGKPGGVKQIHGGSVVMRDCRGGMSVESEDNFGFGLPDHVVEYCQIDRVIGYDLNATKGAQPTDVCYVLKLEDDIRYAQIGQIIGENIINAVSTVDGHLSGPLLIAEGQQDDVPDHVHIGSVIADNCERAVTLTTLTSTCSSVVIDSIQCGQVGYILLAKPFNAPTAATGSFRRVTIGAASAERIERPSNVSGVGILVQNSNPVDGYIINNLAIGTLTYNNAENNGVAIRNVRSVYIGEQIGVTHDTFASGGKFYSDASNYIEADEIYVGRMEIRQAGRQGYAIAPKVKAHINGGIVKNSLATGVRLFGSGTLLVKNLQATDDQTVKTQTTGVQIEISIGTFAGVDVNTGTDRITITSHAFKHNELVRYTEGSGGGIGGLTTGQDAYIIFVDANTVQLSATFGGSAIDLTSAAGTGHTLQKKNNVQIIDVDLRGNASQPFGGFDRPLVIVTRNTAGWLEGSFTYDPPSIGATGQTSTTFTVTDARIGDRVAVSAPYSLQLIIASAYVSANNTVTLVLFNPTGGAIDLASGSWKIFVEKNNR